MTSLLGGAIRGLHPINRSRTELQSFHQAVPWNSLNDGTIRYVLLLSDGRGRMLMAVSGRKFILLCSEQRPPNCLCNLVFGLFCASLMAIDVSALSVLLQNII